MQKQLLAGAETGHRPQLTYILRALVLALSRRAAANQTNQSPFRPNSLKSQKPGSTAESRELPPSSVFDSRVNGRDWVYAKWCCFRSNG
jgi:hypothetical protein